MPDQNINLAARAENTDPWPGPRSYTAREADRFIGRERETGELLWLLDHYDIVVLYGKSGIGKTSLLHAGVLRQLGDIGCTAVKCTYKYAGDELPFSQRLKEDFKPAPQAEAAAEGGFIGTPPDDGETLWQYFHRRDLEFKDGQGNRTTPVIVLDHFESALGATSMRKDATIDFFNELGAVLEHRVSEATRRRLAADPDWRSRFDPEHQSVKVIISLREDYLAELDTWSMRLPSLFKNRFRLLPLNKENATKVITVPGEGIVDPAAVEGILALVAAPTNDPPTQSVREEAYEPILLSLICQRLNGKRKAEEETAGTPRLIDADLVRKVGPNILGDFYCDSFGTMPAKVREWVEAPPNLVTDSGKRNVVREGDIAGSGGPDEQQLKMLIDEHLLIRELRHGEPWIELVHDRLVEPVLESRRRRVETERLEKESNETGEHLREIAAQLRLELRSPDTSKFRQNPKSESGRRWEIIEKLKELSQSPQAAKFGQLLKICFALWAENLCNSGYFDHASGVIPMVDELGAGGKQNDPSNPIHTLMSYVRGVIALGTGDLNDAEDWLTKASLAEPAADSDEPNPDLTRVRVLSKIRLGDVATERYLSKDALRLFEEALELAKAAEDDSTMDDDVRDWKVQAFCGMARNLSIEDSDEKARLIKEAGQCASDKGASPRWKYLGSRVRLLRAAVALDTEDEEMRAEKLDDADNLITDAANAARALMKRDAGNLEWAILRAEGELLRGRVTAGRRLSEGRFDWDEALRTMNEAKAECERILLQQPDWVRGIRMLTVIEWHQAQLLLAKFHEGKSENSNDLLDAIACYKCAEDQLSRLPKRPWAQRGMALCIGGRALVRPDAPQVELFRDAIGVLNGIEGPSRQSPEILGAESSYQLQIAEALKGKDESASIQAYLRYVECVAQMPLPSLNELQNVVYASYQLAEKNVAAGELDLAEANYRRAVEALERAAGSWLSRGEVLEELGTSSGFAGPDSKSGKAVLELSLRRIDILRDAIAAMWIKADKPSRAVTSMTQAVNDSLDLWSRYPGRDGVYEKREKTVKQAAKFLETLRLEAVGTSGENPGSAAATEDANVEALRAVVRRALDANTLPVADERAQNWSLPPLIPGAWWTLGLAEQDEEVSRLPPQAMKKIGDLIVLRVRQLRLDCYEDGWLWEMEVRRPDGRTAIFTYIRQKGRFTELTGEARPLHELNDSAPLKTHTADRAAAYLLLFSTAIQNSCGRFIILQDVNSLHWLRDVPASSKGEIARSIRPMIMVGERGNWIAKATMQYSDAIYYVEMRLRRSGQVEMLTDDPFKGDVPIMAEYFLGGLRCLPERQSARYEMKRAASDKRWEDAAEAASQWVRFIEEELVAPEGPVKYEERVEAYSEWAMNCLLSKDFTTALKAADEVLASMDNNDGGLDRLKFLRADALVFLGRPSEASDVYSQAAAVQTPKSGGGRLKAVEKDLAQFEDAGLPGEGIAYIRTLIGEIN
jgi:hypothetical protein